MKENIGQRIQQARRFLKKSQQEFGDEVGVSQSRQSRIEKNETEIPASYLERVLEKYGEYINEEWLLMGRGYMEKPDEGNQWNEPEQPYEISKIYSAGKNKWTKEEYQNYMKLLEKLKNRDDMPNAAKLATVMLFLDNINKKEE